MTLRLTETEHQELKERADLEGISMQEAARLAVRDYLNRGEHRARIAESATRIVRAHAEALDRLGR